MTPRMFRLFCEEIEKVAAPMGGLVRAARWLSDSPSRTALITGAAGAAHGAYRERQEGGSGVGGALRGGAQGAALGGAAAGVGRAYRDTRLLNPTLGAGQAITATAQRMGQGVKRFGQRQWHGLTGAYATQPGEIGLRSGATAKQKIHLERLRLEDRLRGASPEQRLRLHEKSMGRRGALREEGQRGDRALAAGVTSLPGIARGIVTQPKATARALWQEAGGGSPLGAALMFGVPTALAAPDLLRGDESATGGRTKTQKVLGLGATLATGAAIGGLPIIPQTLAGVGLDTVGQRLVGGQRSSPLARAQGGQPYQEALPPAQG
jgi:hypothetical protein